MAPREGHAPSEQSQNPDVVVIGGGLAGMCAAVAAAQKGASVVVLDRAHGGGTTAISGGVVYAGGGTKQQIEAGYGDDTPDNMFRYLQREVGGAVNEKTLRRFCDESVARMEWLESCGVQFSGSLCPFRTSYPTSKYFLYFSGNEKAYPFAEIAKPAPRGHRVVGGGGSGMQMTGKDLWKALYDSALHLGVQFEGAAKAEELLLDQDRKIRGVRYRAMDNRTPMFAKHKSLVERAAWYHTMTINWMAKRLDGQAEAIWEREAQTKTREARAVILAAGGYVKNESMMEEYTRWAKRVSPLGTAGDDGSGIHLGQAVGGAVSHMDKISIWRLMYPPEGLVEGIVVSPDGERVVAEDMYGASSSQILAEKCNGQGFLILDSKQWAKVKSQVNEQTEMPWRGFILYLIYWAHWKAGSLLDLAGKLGVNPERLESTVTEHNDAIRLGKPDPVHKLNYRSSIETGPFYGIDISFQPSGPLVAPAMGLGGLRVDGDSGLVLNASGATIPGLYAAGRNAVGVCSNSYVSGLSLADCVFSGKRAGEHAASA